MDPPPAPKKLLNFFWKFFFKKRFSSKNKFYGFPGPKEMFLSKKNFWPKTFPGTQPFLSLRPPGNPQDGPQGPQNGHTHAFSVLKNFFQGFAGCPTVLEGSETVGDQSWTALTGEGGGPPPRAKDFPKKISKIFFRPKTHFMGSQGQKKCF